MTILFQKTLAPYTEHTYALLRVFSGLLFSFHGMQKVLGILTSQQPPMGSQIWCGGVIELVGGFAIAHVDIDYFAKDDIIRPDGHILGEPTFQLNSATRAKSPMASVGRPPRKESVSTTRPSM